VNVYGGSVMTGSVNYQLPGQGHSRGALVFISLRHNVSLQPIANFWNPNRADNLTTDRDQLYRFGLVSMRVGYSQRALSTSNCGCFATQHGKKRGSVGCVGSSAAPDSRRFDVVVDLDTVQPLRYVCIHLYSGL